MLIRLANASTDYEEGVDKIISLYFMSDNGYEQAYEFFKNEILNRNRLNEFSKRDCKYDIYSANRYGAYRCVNLKFIYDCDRKNFWNWHILVYGDQDNSNKRIYLDIPGYEWRGGRIPVRTLKFDDLEEQRQKYKERVNQLYGITSISITGPRRNGKSIFFPGYQYEPLKETKWAIPTVTNYYDETEEQYNRFMNLNNISNFVCEFDTKLARLNMAPLYIRSVQINEKKGVVTIVWKDGNVTMAKCGPNDEFDVEKGIAIAFMKHWFASTTQMNKWMREQTKDYYERTFENGFEDEERLPFKDAK